MAAAPESGAADSNPWNDTDTSERSAAGAVVGAAGTVASTTAGAVGAATSAVSAA